MNGKDEGRDIAAVLVWLREAHKVASTWQGHLLPVLIGMAILEAEDVVKKRGRIVRRRVN